MDEWAELRRLYRTSLQSHRQVLSTARAELGRVPGATETIRRVAHKLAGSAGSYGFPEVSQAARVVEAARGEELEPALDALLKALEGLSPRATANVVVLVVEDDAATSLALEGAISGPGRRVVCARSLAEARQVVAERDVSFVVLDLVLPDGDGRDLIGAIRRLPRGTDVPILVASGLGAGVKAECLALGADLFFEKPCGAELVAAVVTAGLARGGGPTGDARSDLVTGLLDRFAFGERVRQAREGALALLEVGDVRLLSRVSSALARQVRPDVVLGRCGVNTLGALFPEADEAEAGLLAERALHAVEAEVPGAVTGVELVPLDSTASAQEVLAEAERRLAGARGPRQPGRRALLVDDDEMVGALLAPALVREGLEPVVCHEGEAALAAARTPGLALVLLDVTMPGKDGFQVAAELRSRPDLDQVPIVLLTGLGSAADVTRGFEVGADDYVVKPFDLDVLLARVRRLLGRRRDPSPAPALPGWLSGGFEGAQLVDLVRLTEGSDRGGMLRVEGESASGELRFRGGRVLDASSSDQSGLEAARRLLRCRRGTFQLSTALEGTEPAPGLDLTPEEVLHGAVETGAPTRLRVADRTVVLRGAVGAAPAGAQVDDRTVVPERASSPGQPPPKADPVVGSTVDRRYEVEALLGQGGMGNVYRARHMLLGTTVALKLLRHELGTTDAARERFLREARVATAFSHPNSIPVREVGLCADGRLYMTQDFSPGRSLRAVLTEGPLEVGRALSLVRQCLLALGHAHRCGIVHRDIKPENVMVEQLSTSEERARICDFGVAKQTWGVGSADLTGRYTIGTPRYMSPEQARGEAVDGRSDLYSMGCTLYEMITGHQVFEVTTLFDLLEAHMAAQPTPPSERSPGLPRRLDTLVLSALAKDPAARPRTAEAFVFAIDALGLIRTGSDPRPATLPPPPPPTLVPPSERPSPASAPRAPERPPSAQATCTALFAFDGRSVVGSARLGADGLTLSEGLVRPGAHPVAIVGHSDGRCAFVALDATDAVASIAVGQDGSIRLLGTTGVGRGPGCLALHPGGKLLYVANRGSSNLTTLGVDPVKGALGPGGRARVSVLGRPCGMAVHPQGTALYVATDRPAAVLVLPIAEDGTLSGATASVPLRSAVRALSVDAEGRCLRTVSFEGSALSTYPLDDGREPRQGAVQHLPTPPGPTALVHARAGLVLVACAGRGQVVALRQSKNLDTLVPVGRTVDTGEGPVAIAVDPTGARAVVACRGSGDAWEYVVESSGLTRVREPVPVGRGPIGLALLASS